VILDVTANNPVTVGITIVATFWSQITVKQQQAYLADDKFRKSCGLWQKSQSLQKIT